MARVQFMAIVDLLITFIENPPMFFEGFKGLTVTFI
jgi:hypothetical protein